MEQPSCMDYAEFRPLMAASANMYLEYIKEKQGYAGKKVISVIEISPVPSNPSDYYFVTTEKVTHADDCQVWINDEYVSSIKILTVMQPRRGMHAIRVCDEKNILHQHPRISPDDVKIVSDLTFLIARLDRFYKAHSFSFQPPAPQELPPLDPKFTEALSEEQLAAVDGVFSSPVSYVSGAPGTGKTRMVLSRCVLRYILNGKRVFLLAPTNNAVEQMLRSILPIFQECGVDLECVYRLGTSSEEFATQYPQVVGDTVLETLKSDLSQQQRILESELASAKKALDIQKEKQNRYQNCKAAHEAIVELFPQLPKQKQQATKERSAKRKASKSMDAIKEEHTALFARRDAVLSKISTYDKIIAQNEAQIERLRHRFWRRKQREQLLQENKDLLVQSLDLQAECNSIAAEISAVVGRYSLAESEYQEACERVTAAESECGETLKKIRQFSNCDAEYSALITTALRSSAKQPLKQAESFLFSLEADCQGMDTSSVDSLQAELDDISQQLSGINASAKLQQRKKALVLAGTIDSSLESLVPATPSEFTVPVAHVFLDEAGYTSLARGMAAFSCGVPVTFLGDHKQLPPVCEMNRIDQVHAPVCLWALSVAYFSELAYAPFDDLYLYAFCRSSGPSFSQVTYLELNTSYRFGSPLANILARRIYSPRFRGIEGAPFDVVVLNAPESFGALPHTSQSEATAIYAYLKRNPTEDVAILTPYRNQLRLLQHTLPRSYRDSILTVHRSQGREWDTVILSVTDTKSPYFTNSSIPIGRSVLNTAISRAKKKLVIACDAAIWSTHPDQMICELIQYAKTLNEP